MRSYIRHRKGLLRYPQVRRAHQWCVLCRSWRQRSFPGLLRHDHRRRRVDCVPEKARRLSRLLPGLEWVQNGLWTADQRVLAGTGQDPSRDGQQTERATSGGGRLERRQGLCQIWKFRCWWWTVAVPAEYGLVFRLGGRLVVVAQQHEVQHQGQG